ncbi:MAG: DUF3822 family protein [Winogradskyella sp.]|uniref:DUF3822 family protein n=1 Tax=Winogradskyella sp. TaxID=1883156 RepID=UPI000F3D8B0E|nr:DUF3822 family protein [Winogradskyella sp.]RNC87172.1 MAG: DUF3822 family protein [Winogradskyella sp.]
MTTKVINELSIQISLNGLSFCIKSAHTNTITYCNSILFENKLTPFETLNRLKTELSSNSIFSNDFNKVGVIYHNELSTLVPQSLYDEAHNAEYLKFNSKILKTDFIATDTIEASEAVNVYIPYVNINNYIFETFGAFTYRHSATVFIASIDGLDKDTTCAYINIENSTMQIVVKDNDNIIFYNYFEFGSKEDFIYYILFSFEQLELDVEHTELKMCGTIEKEDELYNMAYKYVRHVSLLDEHTNFIIKNSF